MGEIPVLDKKLMTRDLVIAASLAIISFVAFLVWSVPGIDPAQWEEVAVASGLRPPKALFPGLWRFLTGWSFELFGITRVTRFLSFVGAVVGSASIVLVYLIMRQILHLLVRIESPSAAWIGRIVPFFAASTAILFGASAPLWDVSQTFSPEGLRLLIFLSAIYLWFRWFAKGGDWRLYPAVALVGVLAAETPFAFLIPVFFIGWYYRLWEAITDEVFLPPEHLPDPVQLPKWRMFFLMVGLLALTAYVNVQTFMAHGGLEANGWVARDAYFRYAVTYFSAIGNAATWAGWALAFGFGLFPVVVALRLFPMVTREDRPMPFGLGAVMMFVGFIAFLQTGVFDSTRFWMFSTETVLVSSGFLLSVCVLASAMTLSACGAAFAMECQRVYLLPEDPRPGVLLRGLPAALMSVILILLVVHVPRSEQRLAQRTVDDALIETVRECGDAQWLFTDGRLDAGLEIAAKSCGRTLTPLNMMSGATAWENALRVRSLTSAADRDIAETGIPALLRVWAREKEGGMAQAAIQLGFDIWTRARKPLPKISGLVARETGMTDEEAERGIKAAREISERVVRACSSSAAFSPSLAAALSSVSWRLSRLARLRRDVEMADKLDATNGAIKRMLSVIEYERLRTFMQMTPQEGLELALKRADFVEARRYAVSVLTGDAKNAEANFAMAMYSLKNGDLKVAEGHLRKVLERRPDEPAALNNLSIICRKSKRYDEAVKLAKHALKILPDSPEVKKTLADAEAKKP